MASNSNLITLNKVDYHFNSLVVSHEVLNPDGPTDQSSSNVETKYNKINFNAFGNIIITESLFLPFPAADFTLNSVGGGVETVDFLYKANNRNQFGLTIARSDTHSTLPTNLNGLSEEQKNTMLYFDGIISVSNMIGSPKSVSSYEKYSCDDVVSCLLKEIKIAQTDITAVDSTLTVAQNIANILLLVISEESIDLDSLNKCTETFPTPIPYPDYFTAYDAIMFLLPFCLGKVNNLDTQLFLRYSKTINKFYFFSPIESLTNFNLSEGFMLGECVGESAIPSEINNSDGVIYLKDNVINSYDFSDVNFDKSNEQYVNVKIINSFNPLVTGQMKLIDIVDEINNFSANALQNVRTRYGTGIKLNVSLDSSKIGKDKALNYRVFRSPYDINKLERVVKSQIYSLFMFENMTLSITVPGEVHRVPGQFITINKTTYGGDFDKSILGVWYITEVKHIIDRKGIYTNQITCTKPFIAI